MRSLQSGYTRVQQMYKQNCKFANSSNPRDAEKEKKKPFFFFSFPVKSHARVNLRPGLMFARFPPCILELGKYRSPAGRVCIICFYCISVLDHASDLFYQATWHGGHIFDSLCQNHNVVKKK